MPSLDKNLAYNGNLVTGVVYSARVVSNAVSAPTVDKKFTFTAVATGVYSFKLLNPFAQFIGAQITPEHATTGKPALATSLPSYRYVYTAATKTVTVYFFTPVATPLALDSDFTIDIKVNESRVG